MLWMHYPTSFNLGWKNSSRRPDLNNTKRFLRGGLGEPRGQIVPEVAENKNDFAHSVVSDYESSYISFEHMLKDPKITI